MVYWKLILKVYAITVYPINLNKNDSRKRNNFSTKYRNGIILNEITMN